MYITIENADASDSNIGSVSLPFDPIPQTQAYLAAISSEGFSDAKKSAIDTFFRRIVNTGLFAKLERIYVPKLGRVDGGINMISPEDENINFPTSDATYNADGVDVTVGWNFPFTKSISNLYIGTYNSVVIPTTSGASRSSIDNVTPPFLLGRRVANTNVNGGVVMTGTARAAIEGSGGEIGLMSCSLSQSLDLISVYSNGLYAEKTPPSTIASWFTITPRLAPTFGAHALFVFGNYLTQEEMGFFEDYVNDLIAGL